MSFTILHHLNNAAQIHAQTEVYDIVVSRFCETHDGSFLITHRETGKHAFAGYLNLSDTKSFYFEIDNDVDIYLYAHFGNEYFQFKQEEYGIVIDAFNNEGDTLEEYGYTMDEDFECVDD